jgi:hypothetical protein
METKLLGFWGAGQRTFFLEPGQRYGDGGSLLSFKLFCARAVMFSLVQNSIWERGASEAAALFFDFAADNPISDNLTLTLR